MTNYPERPVLRYFGGKWLLAPWIISHFPPHRVYVEPYGGAASVLMQKPRSYAEVYNDLDSNIVAYFRILRDKDMSIELERRLRLTPFARDEFNEAYSSTTDPLEAARWLVIRSFMGFGSDGHNAESGKTGFRANSNRSGSTPAHDWVNFPDQIQKFTERLNGVVIENRDAFKVMLQHDGPETLHFVDPPYVHSTRGGKNHSYLHELSDTDHSKLLEFLVTLKGMVILSGYESRVYRSLKWECRRRASLADGARKREECLWLNPAASLAQSQLSLL